MNLRPIALYLPQFHPIPENDEWWGKGFTEWTNVVKAKPLFKGHYQPRFPADLGFYDLRLPEVREQQAELASDHGIYGFCYYHYWFGYGKQLLERPFKEVLESGKPDFPFMLCWANETWQGVWHGASKGKILIDQQYPGKEDYVNHFNHLLKAFIDHRYITMDGKPVFYVYSPLDIPDLNLLVDTFRTGAEKSGLKGLYLVAGNCPPDWNPENYGFDGVVSSNLRRLRSGLNYIFFKNHHTLLGKIDRRIKSFFTRIGKEQVKPSVYDYEEVIDYLSDWPEVTFDYFPQVVPDWDNSPRSGEKSMIFRNASPELWEKHYLQACQYVQRYYPEKQFIFIKSWNEWAESNYLEPDNKYGHQFIEVVKRASEKFT